MQCALHDICNNNTRSGNLTALHQGNRSGPRSADPRIQKQRHALADCRNPPLTDDRRGDRGTLFPIPKFSLKLRRARSAGLPHSFFNIIRVATLVVSHVDFLRSPTLINPCRDSHSTSPSKAGSAAPHHRHRRQPLLTRRMTDGRTLIDQGPALLTRPRPRDSTPRTRNPHIPGPAPQSTLCRAPSRTRTHSRCERRTQLLRDRLQVEFVED